MERRRISIRIEVAEEGTGPGLDLVKKLKVKCTLVQALRLCTGRTAHRRNRGIAVPFLDHGTRRWVRGQRHAPAALYPRERPIPIVQEAGWAPRPVWTGAENLAPTGIRSSDRPTRSKSLYRLSYPTHPRIGNPDKFQGLPGSKWCQSHVI